MSKRFGRNQKRALVAQVEQVSRDKAALDRLYDNSRGQLRVTQERQRDLEEAIAFTREVLGEFFVTLPPVVKQMTTEAEVFRVPVPEAPQHIGYWPGRDVAELVDQVVHIRELQAIRHEFDPFAELRGQMHLIFRTPAGMMSYAFDQHSFRGMKRERVAGIIANSLRRYMLENPAVLARVGVKS